MTTSKKILLGTATAWPLLYIVVFFTLFAVAAFGIVRGDAGLPFLFSPYLVATHLVTMLLMVVLMPLYIKLVTTNPNLPQESRSYWMMMIVVGSVFAMPAYYVVHVLGLRGHAEE